MILVGWFFILFTAIHARGLSSTIGASCLFSLNDITEYSFNVTGADLSYSSRCKNRSFVGSLLLCIQEHSLEVKELYNGYSFLHDVCALQGNVRFTFQELQTICVEAGEYAEHETSFNEEGYSNGTYFVPIKVSNSTYDSAYDAVKGVTKHRLMSTRYGEILLCYWFAVLIIVTIFNLTMWTLPRLVKSLNHTWVRWFRRHFVTPQLLKESESEVSRKGPPSIRTKFLQLAPTRIQTLAIVGYFLLIFVMTVVDYNYVDPNPIYITLKAQKKAYVAIRCGVLAITQLPVMFLFGTRNNPFIILTGMPYRTFNIFHKWIARLVFLLVVLHSFLYLDFVFRNGDYIQRWKTTKFQFANVGLTAIFLIIICSFYKFRQKAYEVFKILHIFFAILFVIGAYYHCYTLGWMEYIYAAIIIWGFDYVMRLKKILLTGGIVYGECQVITDQITNNPHSIKVVIEHSGWWRSFLGSYVYIYFMKRNMFWQSHPFTVIESNPENYNKLVLNIRVKNGLTKVLANWLALQPNQIAKVPLIIEGPYGSTLAFNGYDNALFVAGGIGFTIVYTHAMDLARMFKSKLIKNNYLNNSARPIRMVWLIPNTSFIQTNMQEIINMNKMGIIQLDIYITRGTPPGPMIANYQTSASQTPDMEVFDNPFDDKYDETLDTFFGGKEKVHERCKSVSSASLINGLLVVQTQLMELLLRNKLPANVHYTRPSVKELINNYIETIEHGSTAIVLCGPDPLNYDARLTATKSLKRDIQRIDYFEEKLLW